MEKLDDINEDTCAYEYQAHRDLIPECNQGLSCPYPDKTNCDRYKRLGATEQRFTHFRLYINEGRFAVLREIKGDF